LGLGSGVKISLLFVDLNWSVLLRYKKGTYTIELTVESNDLGIVGNVMKEMVQRID
jgi:hypothetical protein